MNNLSLEELQQFSYRLAIPAVLTLLVNLFGWISVGQIVSVGVHIIVLGIFFLLFKEFKSAFLKLIMVGLVMCLLGEILVFFNLENDRYTTEYWAYLIAHSVRNIVFALAFGWNILKSHIFNPFWTKLTPYFVVVPLFFILQFFVFSLEDSYGLMFILYNASLCVMLLAAALRFNHTSDKSFYIIIGAISLFIISEIFYFLEFSNGKVDPLTNIKEDSILNAFRAPFLQLGSVLIVSGTVDHVIHYKLTVKSRMYLPLQTPNQGFLKTKKPETGAGAGAGKGQTEMKNIFANIGKKKLAEPLI